MDGPARSGPAVSVVVPVFNSEDTLVPLVDALRTALASRGLEHEIVLVDDRSVDGSWDVVRALAAEHREVTGIRLARNFGEHNAVLCGIRAARGAVTVTIDDDLQQPPDAVPALLDALGGDTGQGDGIDLVYGVSDRYQHGVGRQVAAVTTKAVLEGLFAVPNARSVTSFRAFRTDLRETFPASPGPLFSVDALLARSTTRMETVTVHHEPRRSGRTNYTVGKLAAHTMNAVVDGSPRPLQFASVAGAVAMLCALVGLVVAGIGTVAGDWATGPWWIVASIVVGLMGLALVALGVLGEYAARVLLRVGDQPAFVVAETATADPR